MQTSLTMCEIVQQLLQQILLRMEIRRLQNRAGRICQSQICMQAKIITYSCGSYIVPYTVVTPPILSAILECKRVWKDPGLTFVAGQEALRARGALHACTESELLSGTRSRTAFFGFVSVRMSFCRMGCGKRGSFESLEPFC